jgi:hypothetical protein
VTFPENEKFRNDSYSCPSPQSIALRSSWSSVGIGNISQGLRSRANELHAAGCSIGFTRLLAAFFDCQRANSNKFMVVMVVSPVTPLTVPITIVFMFPIGIVPVVVPVVVG